MDLSSDPRIVLTLDAGGTSFRFSAMQGGRQVTESIAMPSRGDDLDRCLSGIVEGFDLVRARCAAMPAAISFAFPGPADYPRGIIGDLGNLPGFRGGVALGPMLEERFAVPVYINNDGDLFAYGEAIAGLLPHVNALLEESGSPRRYRNLLGVTLGTGFGGGIVIDGRLLAGDNSIAGEVWLLRHKLERERNAEEGVSIRAVRRAYAAAACIPPGEAPDPEAIFEIGMERRAGNAPAAREAFRRLGEVAGDAMAQALTLVDGLAVIGGGMSGAWPLFLPALVAELNGAYTAPDGRRFRRLASTACDLEDPAQARAFLAGDLCTVRVPGSRREMEYDPTPRIGVGLSRLGTSGATMLGAYAFALARLDGKG
ncbi:MAG: ROK family protein [Acidobacteria bacterium]|nr:ROK family protein [Acidobacteriota bacterium]